MRPLLVIPFKWHYLRCLKSRDSNHRSLAILPTVPLVAPFCTIPRDYLRDTSLLRAMGFLVSQHGQLGATPPPPFLSVSPLGEHAKWRCDTPPQKGYFSDTCTMPFENKANGCDTPVCDTISKGYCTIWGGISHWAAKTVPWVTRVGSLPSEAERRRTLEETPQNPRRDPRRGP